MEKKEYSLVFFVFFDQMCTMLLICISNHAFFVCSKYKCHIINFLLTSLARYVQRNIGPRSFCTNLALQAQSVQKRPRSDISLYKKLLLTEREVCTEKYGTYVFFVQTEPVSRGLYKKTEVRYFSVKTEQARLIKSLLYGIYRHLYLKQTRNA